MDADTNTLTVDNLVVRKLMQVYELVINKISATNGSLWVSNAGKVIDVKKVEVYDYSFFNLESYEYDRFCAGLRNGDVFIKMPEEISLENLDEEAFSTASGDEIIVRNCYSQETLRNTQFIEVSKDSPTGQLFTDTTKARINPVFEEGFRFDCTFPIITRNNKTIYDNYQNNLDTAKAELVNLKCTQAEQEIIDAKIEEINWYEENLHPKDYVSLIRSYYKYFAGGDFYYVKFDDDNIPVFKAGDLLRCQKWTYGGIKYYDAVVCNYVGKGYIIQLAVNFLDKKTNITYNNGLIPTTTIEEDSRNLNIYKSTNNYVEPEKINRQHNDDGSTTMLTYDQQMDKNLLGEVETDDSLVQIGHLWDQQRQNAVYITSTDDASPYMDVLSGINRPDYSVIYHIPIYQTIKLYQTSYDLKIFTGYNNLVEIPYTGDYYVQDTNIPNYTCEYVCFKFNNIIYLAKGKSVPNQPGINILYYLNTIPDKCSLLGEPSNFYINLEGEEVLHIQLEDGTGNLIQEQQLQNLTLSSTRTVKTRLGNLDGIQDELFPIDKQPYGYGLYGQNVFLTGEFYLSNGQAVADLGKDAMSFAIASSKVGNAAINLLRVDQIRATNLLKASHYNKGTLKTAGMYVGRDSNGDPGIVIWGNKILFATTDLEFDGYVQPTLLLSNGKIQGKYLNVDEAQGTVNAQVLTSEFTVNNVKYTSVDLSPGTVRVYRPKMQNIASNGKVYYTESDQVYYIRRFMLNNNGSQIRWLVVNPDGYPLSKDAMGNYDTITYLNFTYFNSDNEPITYSDGNLPADMETALVNDYSTPLKVWALEKNGKGNLGSSTLYWNSTGKVVVNGVLYGTEGSIGGFSLGKDALYTSALDGNNEIFNPIVISSMKYEYYMNQLSTPYIELNKASINGGIRDRITLTPKGLFYMGNAGDGGVNEFISSQVPSTLFCLTVIPIYLQSKETWTLYARLSCGMNVFEDIYVTYDEGVYALNFHRMEMDESIVAAWGKQREWFLDKLAKGQIHFLISGYNPGYSNDTDADVWHFNIDQMYRYPSHGYSRTAEECVKANIAYMSFKGVNHSLNTNRNTEDYATTFRYSAKIMRTQDKSLWSTDQQTLVDEGGIYYWGYRYAFAQNSFNNYILIETSDDTSKNWGGFNLTALYLPTFDDRFIKETQTKQSDYSEEAQQAINDADLYRTSLIASYGTRGICPTTLTNNLNTKISAMTSEQLNAQSDDIETIQNNINAMTSYAESIPVGANTEELQQYQSELESRYTSISNAINNLEAGNDSSENPN